jgi:hypothetical protein
MPSTTHLTIVDGPTTDGMWIWRCTNPDCTSPQGDEGATPLEDLDQVMTAAIAHGNLDPTSNIMSVIDTAVKLVKIARQLALYDNEMIPLYEAKFPDKVDDLRAHRAIFVANREAIIAEAIADRTS